MENGICYASCLTSGFKILNVTNPNSIVEIGSYVSGGYNYDLQIKDDIAFITDSQLTILNLTDLSNPTLVNNYDPGKIVFGMAVQDDLAFIVVYETGIQAINISSLDSLEVLGEYASEHLVGLYEENSSLYLSMHGDGFKILNYQLSESTDSADIPGVSIAITILPIISLIALFIEKRKAKI